MLLIKNKPIRMALGLVETFNILSLRLWFKNRQRFRSFSGKIFRSYMELVQSDQWESRSIFEIIDLRPGSRITLEHMTGEGIDVHMDELAYLALLTKAASPRCIFEIGTFRGRTALNFALNSPANCEIFTLDLPHEERAGFAGVSNQADASIIASSETGADYRGKAGAEKIEQLFGNSLTFDYSEFVGRCDIVFIDGAHHFEAALSDTRNALEMVKSGGLVIWHDFANYGDYNDVTRAALTALPGKEVVQIASTQLAVYRKP